MKKIKSINFKSYTLTKKSNKWEFEDEISFSEKFIRGNKYLFEIEYEDEAENFEIEIPNSQTLKSGCFITECGEIRSDTDASIFLVQVYNLGNWFLTYAQAEAELSLRKTKVFVNKLIEWCDETSMIGYNETYIKNSSQYGIYYYDGIIKSCCLSNCNYDFRISLKSWESVNLFIKQMNLPKNETHRSNLIQILKSGKL